MLFLKNNFSSFKIFFSARLHFSKAKEIKSIIVEYFSQKTELYKELELYSSLKDNSVEEDLAESFLKEVENRYFRLNPTKKYLMNKKKIIKIAIENFNQKL